MFIETDQGIVNLDYVRLIKVGTVNPRTLTLHCAVSEDGYYEVTFSTTTKAAQCYDDLMTVLHKRGDMIRINAD